MAQDSIVRGRGGLGWSPGTEEWKRKEEAITPKRVVVSRLRCIAPDRGVVGGALTAGCAGYAAAAPGFDPHPDTGVVGWTMSMHHGCNATGDPPPCRP